MIAVEEVVTAFRSPKGAPMTMCIRAETADYNNVRSCTTEDEYGLHNVDLGDGYALDIGAHVGGVAIGLALDNPQARITAVECLSANVALLRENVQRNGVGDRVTVLHAIAASRKGTGTVRWNFDQDEAGQHHRFIANAHKMTGGEEEQVENVTLTQLATEPVAFMKIDCEGGEYDFLLGPALGEVAEIRGEFHAGIAGIVDRLDVTHVVSMTSGTEAFGGFRAVRR